ncbi:putative carboxypeptidase D [Helianthus annuus]|nr:putative carboxypeptidase D [Helianthus annuus]
MEDDYIHGGLPGQPLSKESKFKQYSGYINVDSLNGRSLFYYFVEALDEPSSKPLVLWLNGGPGCSSLGVGAMLEIGPFGVNPDGKTLYSRRFSWNKVANILFLESPAGVGFSYSNTSTDYDLSGDKRTGLIRFLGELVHTIPRYKNHDLFIIGESYAGFYIPELADVITKKNMKGHSSSIINLKGIMIGNGIMNEDTDNKGFNDYLWSHALISDEIYTKLSQNCSSNAVNSDYCNSLEEELGEDIGDIDFYNIYGPTCTPLPAGLTTRRKRHSVVDPCEGEYVEKYLNLADVQNAFHANITKLSYPWSTCRYHHSYLTPNSLPSGRIGAPSTMFPIYKRLIASGLRILLYRCGRGCSVSGTRYSIDAMNLKVVKPWRFWTDSTKQVAGYKVVYDGLTFATVRGAGHEVPRFQPRQAFALLKMFLANRD